MRLLRFQSRTPIGLDLGARHIKAAQLSHGPRGWRIEAVAVIQRPSDATADMSGAELANLERILTRKGFIGRELVLAVPQDKLLSSVLELPPIDSSVAMSPIVRTEFCRAQKVESSEIQLAHWEIPAPVRAARGMHVMAAACRRLDSEAIVEQFAALDWHVIALDVASIATARACAGGSPLTRLTAILDIGWSGAKLLVLRDETILFDRVLSEAGIRTLQANIITQMRLPEDVTSLLLQRPKALQVQDDGREKTPSDYDIENPQLPMRVVAEMCSLIRDHFDLLGAEVSASMSYASQRYPDAGAQQLLLVGGGAAVAGAAEQLQQIVGCDCRVLTPLASASCGEILGSQCSAILTPACGLARFVESDA